MGFHTVREKIVRIRGWVQARAGDELMDCPYQDMAALGWWLDGYAVAVIRAARRQPAGFRLFRVERPHGLARHDAELAPVELKFLDRVAGQGLTGKQIAAVLRRRPGAVRKTLARRGLTNRRAKENEAA